MELLSCVIFTLWKNIYLKTLFALWEKYILKKARWTLEAKVKRAETLIKKYEVCNYCEIFATGATKWRIKSSDIDKVDCQVFHGGHDFSLFSDMRD